MDFSGILICEFVVLIINLVLHYCLMIFNALVYTGLVLYTCSILTTSHILSGNLYNLRLHLFGNI